jgi:hypothetical protein
VANKRKIKKAVPARILEFPASELLAYSAVPLPLRRPSRLYRIILRTVISLVLRSVAGAQVHIMRTHNAYTQYVQIIIIVDNRKRNGRCAIGGIEERGPDRASEKILKASIIRIISVESSADGVRARATRAGGNNCPAYERKSPGPAAVLRSALRRASIRARRYAAPKYSNSRARGSDLLSRHSFTPDVY